MIGTIVEIVNTIVEDTPWFRSGEMPGSTTLPELIATVLLGGASCRPILSLLVLRSMMPCSLF